MIIFFERVAPISLNILCTLFGINLYLLSMLDNEYIKIFSGTFIIVQLLKDRLENVGINAIVKDESESARMAGFGSSFQGFQELLVSSTELDAAIPVLDAVKLELKLK